MQIFISWSGERSKAVAEALRGWLPKLIQALRPWMSSSDINKGQRWSVDVANQLHDCKIGIICLTPENLTKPWILFEAGALSKTLEMTFVCPYLYDIADDIEGPLSQFQATKAEKEDTFKLMQTINGALDPERALDATALKEMFELLWPALEEKLKSVPPAPETTRPGMDREQLLRQTKEMVEMLARM